MRCDRVSEGSAVACECGAGVSEGRKQHGVSSIATPTISDFD